MMRRRRDCWFYFFTKRIDRLAECLPPDWGEGYENVIIGCTVENQDRADARLPLFLELPIRHRTVIAAPLLTALDLREGASPIPAQEKRGLFLGNSGMIAMMVLSGILMLYVAFLA